MRLHIVFTAVAALLWGAENANGTVIIKEDLGGRIGTYVDKYEGLRTSGEDVVIDGPCASACTLVLGAVANERICVTSRAILGFHAAWDYGTNAYGKPATIPNREATEMIYAMYPTPVRRWITLHGGLKPKMIFLRGKQLTSMYRRCNVWANTFAHSLY